MKKVISLFLILGMVFEFALFNPTAAFADDEAVGNKAETSDSEMKAAFGIGDKVWYDNPQNNSEHLSNFLLAYCAGDWDYIINVDKDDISRVSWSHSLKPYCNLYNALLGAFTNQNEFYATCIDGKYYIVTQGAEPILSKDELMEQQASVYKKAVSIRKDMVKSGQITDKMSEKAKCNAYYKLLSSWNIKPSDSVGNIDYYSSDPSYRTVFMKYDSAYACLVKKVADCGGRSAGFSLLMNMEGIKSFGMECHFKNTDLGHIITYVLLDNEEYLSDFSNNIKTSHIDSDSIKKKLILDESYLHAIREELGKKETQDINDSAKITINDAGDNVEVTVVVAKDYSGNNKASYRINYGIEGNCMYTPGFTLEELIEGVTVMFPKDEIEKHNIPATVFIN